MSTLTAHYRFWAKPSGGPAPSAGRHRRQLRRAKLHWCRRSSANFDRDEGDTNPGAANTGGGANARLAVESLFRFLALDKEFHPADYLSDSAKPAFEAARTGCNAAIEETADHDGVTTENVFKKSPEAAAANAAKYLRFPRARFAHPVFIGTGLDDITAYPQAQYNFIMAACHEGSTVEAHYYPGKDHSGAVNASLVDSVPFVKKILAGQRIASNCNAVRPPQ